MTNIKWKIKKDLVKISQWIFNLLIIILLTLLFFFLLNRKSVPDHVPESQMRQNSFEIALQNMKLQKYDAAFFYFTDHLNHEQQQITDTTILCYLHLCDISRLNNEFHKADSFLCIADSIQRFSAMNPIIIGQIHYYKSGILLKKNEMDKAFNEINSGISLLSSLSESTDSRYLLSKLHFMKGSIFHSVNQLDEALEQYDKALKYQWMNPACDTSTLVFIYNNLGLVNKSKHLYNMALRYYNKAISLCERKSENFTRELAMCNNNLAGLFFETGMYVNSLDYYIMTEHLYRSIFNEDYYKLADIYYYMGQIYQYTGNLKKAEDYFKRSERIFDINHKTSRKSKVYMGLANIHYEEKDYTRALEFYKKGLNNVKNAGFEDTSSALIGIANCLYYSGNADESEKYYKKAIKSRQDTYGKDNYLTGFDYLSYGTFCLNTGKEITGLDCYQKACSIFHSNFGDKHPYIAKYQLLLGEYYEKKGRLPEALKYYHASLISNIEEFNESDILKIPAGFECFSKSSYLESVKRKAMCLYKLGMKNQVNNSMDYLTSGYHHYEKSIDLIYHIRNFHSEQEMKLNLSDTEKHTYAECVAVLMKLFSLTENKYYSERAFQICEKSKSAMMLAGIKNNEALRLRLIPDSVSDLNKYLNTSIYTYQNLLVENREKNHLNDPLIRQYEDSLINYYQQKDQLHKFINNKFPTYYRFIYDTSVLSTACIQGSLRKNQVILEYLYTDTLLFCFILSNHDFKIEQIRIDTSFNQHIIFIHEYLSKPAFLAQTNSQYLKFNECCHYLYSLLIEPITNHLNNKELIIIPDEYLFCLPFDVLLCKLPNTIANVSNHEYLIEKYLTSYAYSATILFTSGKQTRKSNGKIMFIDSSGGKSSDNNQTADQSPVLNTSKERKFLSSNYKVDFYTGESANETSFKAFASKYTILHIPCHTELNNFNPLLTSIKLGRAKNSGEDGRLKIFEIYNQSFNAELAVLNSCNTGLGILNHGEGFVSLAHSFMYAGCPSLLYTLWRVEDASSSELTVLFYKYLSQSYTKSEALRKAKLEFLKKSDPLRVHPHYWSGFMLIGDTKPLQHIILKNEPPGILLYMIIILGLFLAIVIGWRKSKMIIKSV